LFFFTWTPIKRGLACEFGQDFAPLNLPP
jgi:hypothetical protein